MIWKPTLTTGNPDDIGADVVDNLVIPRARATWSVAHLPAPLATPPVAT